MSENKKYTIVVKNKRVEVSEAVYRAYHQEREAERYRNKVIHQCELSLDRFQEEGVNTDYLVTRYQPSIEDKIIQQEQLQGLQMALHALTDEEQVLIQELFFNNKSERMLAAEIGIPNMTLHDRKHRILKKLKKLLDN